jgi:hypothetical protein
MFDKNGTINRLLLSPVTKNITFAKNLEKP